MSSVSYVHVMPLQCCWIVGTLVPWIYVIVDARGVWGIISYLFMLLLNKSGSFLFMISRKSWKLKTKLRLIANLNEYLAQSLLFWHTCFSFELWIMPSYPRCLANGELMLRKNQEYTDTISPHMVVGLFLSRIRLSGTACATNCENRC